MKNYIGVKIVKAEPKEKNGVPGYAVKYPDGYVSWSPKETFEKAYRELDARFCRMTGKKPDADELFGKPAVRQSVPAQKEAPENGARENRMCRRKGRRPGF